MPVLSLFVFVVVSVTVMSCLHLISFLLRSRIQANMDASEVVSEVTTHIQTHTNTSTKQTAFVYALTHARTQSTASESIDNFCALVIVMYWANELRCQIFTITKSLSVTMEKSLVMKFPNWINHKIFYWKSFDFKLGTFTCWEFVALKISSAVLSERFYSLSVLLLHYTHKRAHIDEFVRTCVWVCAFQFSSCFSLLSRSCSCFHTLFVFYSASRCLSLLYSWLDFNM